jgi:hypothetical protein
MELGIIDRGTLTAIAELLPERAHDHKSRVIERPTNRTMTSAAGVSIFKSVGIAAQN